jgi:hypothetical protein
MYVHAAFSKADLQFLQDTLVGMKHCFAYSMKELPGYCGSHGPLHINLRSEYKDLPIFTKQRLTLAFCC